MRLAIVVGHTKLASGAFAVDPIRQSEYYFNTEIAEIMYRHARSIGLECRIFLRDQIGVAGAYAEANIWAKGHKSCLIELHFNAANGKAKGSETLYDKDPLESKQFAELVQAAMKTVFNRTGKQDRGLKLIEPNERGGRNLLLCTFPSVLVEPFFGDNKEECELALKVKNQYAESLVKASFAFLNLPDLN